MRMSGRMQAAGALAVAAAAWPGVVSWISWAAASPLERALRGSWCVGAPQSLALLGHCPSCWVGATALAASAALVAWRPRAARA